MYGEAEQIRKAGKSGKKLEKRNGLKQSIFKDKR